MFINKSWQTAAVSHSRLNDRHQIPFENTKKKHEIKIHWAWIPMGYSFIHSYLLIFFERWSLYLLILFTFGYFFFFFFSFSSKLVFQLLGAQCTVLQRLAIYITYIVYINNLHAIWKQQIFCSFYSLFIIFRSECRL